MRLFDWGLTRNRVTRAKEHVSFVVNDICAFLEMPATHGICKAGPLQLSGWVYGTRRIVRRLWVLREHHAPTAVYVGLARPDVAARFEHNIWALDCGFAARLPPAVDGETVSIVAEYADGEQVPLFSRLLRVEDCAAARNERAQLVEGISVIIPVFNRVALLRDAVQSVRQQTEYPLQLILVDDGSDDVTRTQCLQWAEEENIDVIRQPHGGRPGQVREMGRQIVHGDYVQYLDSDDLLMPAKFVTLVSALQAESDCDVAYTPTYRVAYEGGETIERQVYSAIAHTELDGSVLSDRFWFTATPLYRRTVVDRLGPWWGSRLWEDSEYHSRLLALGTKLAFYNQPLTEVRDHDQPRLSHGTYFKESSAMREAPHTLGRILRNGVRAGLYRDDPCWSPFLLQLEHVQIACADLGLHAAFAECQKLKRDWYQWAQR